MDLSAPIFVVLALAWVVYLVPKALKHHDEVARTRSIDRFSHTMRVLARREPVDTRDARLVVAPARGSDNPRVVVPTDRPSRARLQFRRRAAAAAARRRRRVLILLLLANTVVGTLDWLGYLQRWAVAVPVGITLLYLVLCRTLVRRERRAAGSARRTDPAVEEWVDLPSIAIRNEQGFEEVTTDEDTTTIDAAALAAAFPTTDAGSLWDPLPVTLPTYVGKPKAARTVRTIDLADPNVSSSGRDAADSRLVAEAEAAAEVAEPETVKRRAVGS